VLSLQTLKAEELAADRVRVAMTLSPVNASDLIPITGAYRHRITLPAIAGYEGVGTVIQAPAQAAHLLGKRVLPLRGQGTWQRLVDSPLAFTVPVPDDISDTLAARAYINPLAALLMLNLYPPAGKHVLITAAGSDCAALLGQWALKRGALSVTGVHRSPVHRQKLAECGIQPLEETRARKSRPWRKRQILCMTPPAANLRTYCSHPCAKRRCLSAMACFPASLIAFFPTIHRPSGSIFATLWMLSLRAVAESVC
jgi:NADPH:quinone reductase-like Zn-dependent oxidoreductase